SSSLMPALRPLPPTWSSRLSLGEQVQFAALLISAAVAVRRLPVNDASSGNLHSGMVRATPLAGLSPLNLVAAMLSGPWPCSTQFSSAVSVSKRLGPGPPPQ